MNMMPVILAECQRPPGLKNINYQSLRGKSRVITVRTVIPCISRRPTCRCRAHSAVGPLFGYSRMLSQHLGPTAHIIPGDVPVKKPPDGQH